jgi:hypothetical protein
MTLSARFRQACLELEVARHGCGEPLSNAMAELTCSGSEEDWLETAVRMFEAGSEEEREACMAAVNAERLAWQYRPAVTPHSVAAHAAIQAYTHEGRRLRVDLRPLIVEALTAQLETEHHLMSERGPAAAQQRRRARNYARTIEALMAETGLDESQ